jgi:uncharacterized membrane protein (DUF485 family)
MEMEPIQFNVIFRYGVEMTLTLLIAYGLYLLRVQFSPTAVKAWVVANSMSMGISFAVSWLLSAAIVASPGISAILGSFGFNASQSAAGMALVIAGFTIGSTAEPTAKPSE